MYMMKHGRCWREDTGSGAGPIWTAISTATPLATHLLLVWVALVSDGAERVGVGSFARDGGRRATIAWPERHDNFFFRRRLDGPQLLLCTTIAL